MLKNIHAITITLFLSLVSPLLAAQEHPSQTMVTDAITAMLAVFKEEGDKLESDPAFLQSKLNEHILPILDFETMTRLAVGKFWRRADETQQETMVNEFQTLLINTYSDALTQYSGEAIEFEPYRAERREDRAVVRSVFNTTTGDAVPVIYKLRDKGGWSVYDIEVNEISLVTSYRSGFSSEIEKGGIEGLINTLKKRNGSA